MKVKSLALPVAGLFSTVLAQGSPANMYLWGEGGARMEKRIVPTKSEEPRALAPLDARQAACTNGPTTRNCWSQGLSVNTNQYQTWPTGGQIRDYDLMITNTTCNPDGGGLKPCVLINGQYPGPTLYANWGDTFRIQVRNMMQHNGTSIHWHGLRQLGSNIQDGVNGITECALAAGDAKTYTFKATEYGTTWYHSHFSAQYGDGTVGAIVINGPASANYDTDLGTYTLSDWYYKSAFFLQASIFVNAQSGGGGVPPAGDNILINGTNKNAAGGGSFGKVTLTPGKKHRLRLINTSVDASIRVSLDGHNFTVISTDFVPVTPYNASWLLLHIGQRYDVIIEANQTVGNYWFRAEGQNGFGTGCLTNVANTGKSIFSYSGATAGDPTSSPNANAPVGCPDGRTDGAITPVVAIDVPKDTFVNQAKSLSVEFKNTTNTTTNQQNLVLWTVNGSPINVDVGKPTIQYVMDGNNNFPQEYNVIQVPQGQQWTYWIIQQNTVVPHPIHLHGHDYFVLGSGAGAFDIATATLQYKNPVRRDTALLPGNGWLVIAFPTDNPGIWLMHCHIAWHVAMGLSVQFLERKSEINLPAPNSPWTQTCLNWKNYEANEPKYPQTDSGLRKRSVLDDMSFI